jgi:hypothetical protein
MNLVRFLRLPFYLGLSAHFIFSLLRLQHWPGLDVLRIISLSCFAIFFLLVFAEMIGSRKARPLTKIIWLSTYVITLAVSFYFIFFSLLAIVVLGILYLRVGRKYFLHNKKDYEKIEFDSI